MEQPETQENTKETRGRPGKMISLSLELPMVEFQAAHALLGRRIRQEGKYMTLEKVFIDAIQSYSKTVSNQE